MSGIVIEPKTSDMVTMNLITVLYLSIQFDYSLGSFFSFLYCTSLVQDWTLTILVCSAIASTCRKTSTAHSMILTSCNFEYVHWGILYTLKFTYLKCKTPWILCNHQHSVKHFSMEQTSFLVSSYSISHMQPVIYF